MKSFVQPNSKVGVAIIGAGYAAWLHLQAYQQVHSVDFEIKAIVDSDIEKASQLAKKYGISQVFDSISHVLSREDITVIDIVTPPVTHIPLAIKAIKAGKHVICEKPLTGYFGQPEDELPIGLKVSGGKMLESVLREMDALADELARSESVFMYAENYIYAPSIHKSLELCQRKKSKMLFIKGELSLRGSSSPLSGQWDKVGGGSLMRMGAHPLSAILWLKQQESAYRSETIRLESLICEVGRIAQNLSAEERKHLTSNSQDVEDFVNLTLNFSDGTRAIVIASDHVFGGTKNYMEIYSNDGAMVCNMTPANNLMTYFLDDEAIEDVDFAEMLPTKVGWNYAFIRDEILRGYVGELQDFMECAATGRKPLSDFQLAYDTIKTIYLAYQSAREGKRIEL